MHFKFFTALVLVLGITAQANAGVLIEPYLGYNSGKWEQGSSNEKLSGVNYGARLGYQHALGLNFGLDYFTGKWQDKADVKADITPAILGAFVGFEFPVLLRVYAVYGFKNEAKFKDRSRSVKYEGGNSIKLGVGFTALPLLSINVEYMATTLDEVKGNSLTNDMNLKTYGISVSAPFDL